MGENAKNYEGYLMAEGIKDLIIELIGEEQAPAFALWAFGEDYNKLPSMQAFAKAWNLKNQHLYKLEMENAIYYDIVKMIKLWKQINE